MWMNRKLVLVIGVMIAATLACGPIDLARDILGRLPTATPATSSATGSSTTWYVATDGDDANFCQESSDPCRTISEVLSRVSGDDLIYVGAGSFSDAIEVGYMLHMRDMNVRIEGEGRDVTVIDGQDGGGVILISGDSRVSITDLSVRNGSSEDPGQHCIVVNSSAPVRVEDVLVEHCTPGGIRHSGDGELSLLNVTVRDAYTDTPGRGGGGVRSSGPLVVQGGEFSDNDGRGLSSTGRLQMTGAVFERNGLEGLLIGGEATVENVTIAGNDIDPTLGQHHPGLLIRESGNATVAGSRLENNDNGVRVLSGGRLELNDSFVMSHPRAGLLVDPMAVVTVRRTTIGDNGSRNAGTSLVGGILNEGNLTLVETIVDGNHNGGIGNYENLTMRGSTVRANFGGLAGLYNIGDADIEGSLFSGQIGGEHGVENRGLMTMVNSTISGNEQVGLGLVSNDGVILRYVTIANNHIGLNAHSGGEHIRLIANSLIANNAGRSDCLFGAIAPDPALEGVNLDSDGSCRFTTAEAPTAVGLGPLQDNGGPTLTHAIAGDSEALDAARGDCPSTDQRGASRPVGLNCDVGAYELGAVTMSGTAAPDLFSTVTPTPAGSIPTVAIDTLCWQGPGPLYQVVSSLSEGTQVTLLGRGAEGQWWVIDNPRYPGVACWVEDEDLSVDPLIELNELRIFAIPPLPTPTATPILGCLYYDQNQAEVCYPIDQCPVDFEDSLGACTP